MKRLKLIAMLLVIVAIVSASGCAEKAQSTGNIGNETQSVSENATATALSTKSITPAKNVSTPGHLVIHEFKNSTSSTSSTVVDVVCKMKINKNTAKFTSEYNGTTYYFCSSSCKQKFDENPEKYIGSDTGENNSDTTEDESQETSEQMTSATMSSSTNSTSSTVVDVVCKMEIDKNTAEFTSEYDGITYYFCSSSCKQAFDENPEKYIGSDNTENNSDTTENESQEASENDTQETSEQMTSATMNNSTNSTSSTVVDLVCKMEIDKNTAEFTSEYNGTTYYFCSSSCKQAFDENPEKYIGSKDKDNETQENCKTIKVETKNSETTENKNQAASKSCS